MQEKDIARFWGKVEKSDGCWEWRGAKDPDGYGVFQLERKARKAHRVAYQITSGEIPKGMFICHACDNPKCVNPAHLWIGTAADNNKDRSIKGRTNRLSANKGRRFKRPEGVHRGEKNPRAKLTAQQVEEIRSRFKPWNVTAKTLAAEYGVSVSTIWRIVEQKGWN